MVVVEGMSPVRTPWQAWRALPRAVRKEVRRLAKAGHGHPDPAVARTSLAWGRSVRRVAGWLRFAAVACIMAGFGAADYLRVGSRERDLAVSAVVIGIGAVGAIVLRDLIQRAARAEHANLRALLFSDRSSWPDVGTSPVTIHRGRRFRWYELACVLPAAIVLLPDRELGGPDAFSFVCFAVAAVILAALFVRVHPGGRTPLMVLSPDGLQVPHRRLTVPWSAIAWADLTVRGEGMNENLALTWTLGPTAVHQPSTMVIPVSWMVEDPEVALTASRRFAEAAR
jgi:hypothetical protein